MANLTGQIVEYRIIDVINSTEAQLLDFDTEKLTAAEEAGAIFIAVYDDGHRERVAAKDITQPEPVVNGFTVCQPQYVNDRIKAVIKVINAAYDRMDNIRNYVTGINNDQQYDQAYGAALSELELLLEVENDNA